MDKSKLDAAIGNMKVQAVLHQRTITFLAVGFVASFAAMVSSAYCADHIRRSSCSGDEYIGQAYTWSWMSAVMEALVAIGTASTIVYLMMRKDKPIE